MEEKINQQDFEKQKAIIEFQMLQQQAQQIQAQVEAIQQQEKDMEELKASILATKGSKGKELLANLGKGIFIKTSPIDEKLFINVGSGIIVKRSTDEAAKIINNQVERLNAMNKQANLDLMNNQAKLEELVSKLQ